MKTFENFAATEKLPQEFLSPPVPRRPVVSGLTRALSHGSLHPDSVLRSIDLSEYRMASGKQRPAELMKDISKLHSTSAESDESSLAGLGPHIRAILDGDVEKETAQARNILREAEVSQKAPRKEAQEKLNALFHALESCVRGMSVKAKISLLLAPVEKLEEPAELAILKAFDPIDKREGAKLWNKMSSFFRENGLDAITERGQKQLSALLAASTRVPCEYIEQELSELATLIHTGDPQLRTIHKLTAEMKAFTEQYSVVHALSELQLAFKKLPAKVQADIFEILSDAISVLHGARHRTAFDQLEMHMMYLTEDRVRMMREKNSPPSSLKWQN